MVFNFNILVLLFYSIYIIKSSFICLFQLICFTIIVFYILINYLLIYYSNKVSILFKLFTYCSIIIIMYIVTNCNSLLSYFFMLITLLTYYYRITSTLFITSCIWCFINYVLSIVSCHN